MNPGMSITITHILVTFTLNPALRSTYDKIQSTPSALMILSHSLHPFQHSILWKDLIFHSNLNTVYFPEQAMRAQSWIIMHNLLKY